MWQQIQMLTSLQSQKPLQQIKVMYKNPYQISRISNMLPMPEKNTTASHQQLMTTYCTYYKTGLLLETFVLVTRVYLPSSIICSEK